MPGMEKTMHEFKKGKLHSGSKEGPKVTSRAQAIAIGLSQAREAGEDVPPPKKGNPGYEKGGYITQDQAANVHAGEIILPARTQEPPTDGDSNMSDDHLNDSISFNLRHATDHVGAARKAEEKLRERGLNPRMGSVADTINRALGMPLSGEASHFQEAQSGESEPTNPVESRKRSQRASAERVVREGGLPKNYTRGDAAARGKK